MLGTLKRRLLEWLIDIKILFYFVNNQFLTLEITVN